MLDHDVDVSSWKIFMVPIPLLLTASKSKYIQMPFSYSLTEVYHTIVTQYFMLKYIYKIYLNIGNS
jgi:hypothetical protein